MILFGLDASGKTASVAIMRDAALIYESYLASGNTHSETLLVLCDNAFRAAQLSPSEIDVFCVTAGPGSFTGLRIGLGTVKGLCFPFNTPCAPVSTLSALAHTWPSDGFIATALDARRGEVYGAVFKRENGILQRLTPDTALTAAALQEQLSAYNAPCICLGDGAYLLQNSQCTLAPDAYLRGRAHGVCLAGLAMAQENACVSGEQLMPEYLRLSQAEREKKEREQ